MVSLVYERTKHGTYKSSRHLPHKRWMSFSFFLRNYLRDRGVFHLRLESEEGNQFFAAVDLKTVRVAEKVDEGTVEKVNKHRFTN